MASLVSFSFDWVECLLQHERFRLLVHYLLVGPRVTFHLLHSVLLRNSYL